MKNDRWILISIFSVIVFKMLFLLTHHIQEDAFITWRVAQNLLDYGVIGFNGDTKISASTTHLYVFLSYFFNLILGKDHFMYPLLVFNSILFTIGSYFLAKMLLKDTARQCVFIIIFGLLPPAIKISSLGMEYGLLFFLEISLLYFGFYKDKNWAKFIFPTLILFTRIDTVIFLGIVFLVDAFRNRRIQWRYVAGGVVAVAVVLSFNWFYFHEIINNTIVAKKIAYQGSYTFSQKTEMFLQNFGNFYGMLKMPGNTNIFTILILILELSAFIFLIRRKQSRNFYLITIFIFGWVKQLVFLSQRSYFDWYYWVPQLLLFVPVLIFVLEKTMYYRWTLGALIITIVLPLLLFQTVHSIATGNGEWNYRRSIGTFLDSYEKDKNQWIFLEPAGYVPYFSHLKTMDEVGLVDKGVQREIIKDRKNYWLNTVKKRRPKYLLSYIDLFKNKDSLYYRENFRVLKEFRISEHLDSPNPLLNKIYHLKPSGRDYVLYEKKF